VSGTWVQYHQLYYEGYPCLYHQDQGNYNPYERDIEAKQRPGQNLPADSQYTMVMPQRNENPNAARLMTTAQLMDWSKGWPKTNEIWSRPATQATGTTASTATTVNSTTNNSSTATVTTATTTSSAQHHRQKRATDPEVMVENDSNRTRRSRRQVSTASNASVVTSSISPIWMSSNSVQIVQPPPSTVIDLTVESIEDLMVADVQEQKAALDNKTSEPNDKATKGKRKHVATGNLRGRPPRDPNKDGDRDKSQGMA
jgi:hypothetical protein